MKHVFRSAKHLTTHFGVSSSTLRRWANTGKLRHIRSIGGKRFYDAGHLGQLLGSEKTTRLPTTHSRILIYARVSSAKQRQDLMRQIEELQEAYPQAKVVKDVASGVNFKRKGLRSVLEQCYKGVVDTLVVMHRDRLARFGAELLEHFLEQHGVRLVVHAERAPDQDGRLKGQESPLQLAEDLLAITTVFVASHHGKRAAEARKRRRQASIQTSQKRTLQSCQDS